MSKMYEALRKVQQQGASVDLVGSMRPVSSESFSSGHQSSNPLDTSDDLISSYEDADDHSIRSQPMQTRVDAPVVAWDTPNSLGGEQYRIIRTRIVQHPACPKMIVVSSAGAGDGKTVSAVNIAGVLSVRDNVNVLLMDADFRRAGTSSMLGLSAAAGLADTLSGACTIQNAIVRVQQFPNLYVLPAGRSAVASAELLDSQAWQLLCATIRKQFSYVIVDGPPIAAVADYELIQASCDGVIVVVRPDHTDRTLFNRAFGLIPEGQRLGVVLNCARNWFLWKTHESYRYDSGD